MILVVPPCEEVLNLNCNTEGALYMLAVVVDKVMRITGGGWLVFLEAGEFLILVFFFVPK